MIRNPAGAGLRKLFLYSMYNILIISVLFFHLYPLSTFITADILARHSKKSVGVIDNIKMAAFHLGEQDPGSWCCACYLTVMAHWDTLWNVVN